MSNTNISRRYFLKAIGIGATSMAYGTWWRCGSADPKREPNILFIAIDDLNDWVNCLGGYQGKVYTPHLDRLASSGVLFTNAHCSAPSCNPSRASLMTGIRPTTSGVYGNNQHWRESPVLKNAVTIPEHFMSHGYRVVGGGKIFHALEWVNVNGRDGQNDPKCWHSYFPSKIKAMPNQVRPNPSYQKGNDWVADPVLKGEWPEGKRGERWKGPHWFFDSAPMHVADKDMSDAKIVDWAIGELQKEHEKPFFIATGIFRPHVPFYVPQKYFDMYPLDEIQLPELRKDWKKDLPTIAYDVSIIPHEWHHWLVKNGYWKRFVQGYLAAISFADAQLGRLIDALDSSAYGDNTIVVLWSDHGFQLGERENWEKFTLWEESTRVIFTVRAPGITQAGGRCERPVSLLDIYPTLIDLAGHKPRPELEGVSLVPLLKNPNAPRERPAITTYGEHQAVRSQNWRYIRYGDGSEELYDHRTDPDETNNLAKDKKYKAIKNKLSAWLPERKTDY